MTGYAFQLDLSEPSTTTLLALNISTLACLQFFADEQVIEISEFGATNYQHYGWTTENDIPQFNSVGQLKHFLSQSGDIGLYSFTATINHAVIVQNSYDANATIHFKDCSQCMAFIKSLIPNTQQNRFINALVEHQKCFTGLDVNGEIAHYASIDAFQAKRG